MAKPIFVLCVVTVILTEGARLLFLGNEAFCQQQLELRSDVPTAEMATSASYDYIVKRKGEEWELWDRRSILYDDQNLHCQWTV
jgi:hypothetical protein